MPGNGNKKQIESQNEDRAFLSRVIMDAATTLADHQAAIDGDRCRSTMGTESVQELLPERQSTRAIKKKFHKVPVSDDDHHVELCSTDDLTTSVWPAAGEIHCKKLEFGQDVAIIIEHHQHEGNLGNYKSRQWPI